ncbi:MAG: hypothetical protein GY913_04580 [Proteobacteria bacterium]|nr:hypothetical protein [Pseudomonadota bacterium]MCP4916178.1 hypothetical protein [Pseudomonadota bacterium]
MFLLLACAGATVELTPEVELDTAVEVVPGVDDTPDPQELPDGMPTVEIRIEAAAMERLDADPHLADDEVGTFVYDGTEVEVELNYRGAYQLRNVMSAYDLRNWKVKFPSEDRYLGHREWNLNYEPHFRQKLAYDLFRFAGVQVPSTQHVVLLLNGAYQGMYLRYEDPDDKAWLNDSFGDDSGDLYKAATDLPGVPQCFADLTVLGPSDEDYLCHYQKKTNHKDAPDDFSVLRAFVEGLEASDTAWFSAELDVDSFLSYLVVQNFVSLWDSYPQRPKNYWLYAAPERMVFIPWDLDGTFNPSRDSTWNQMGTTASVLFELHDGSDYSAPNQGEGDERPLVHRLMSDPAMESAYLERYRVLADELLNPEYLLERQDALSELVAPEISGPDADRLSWANQSVEQFVRERHDHVIEELDGL